MWFCQGEWPSVPSSRGLQVNSPKLVREGSSEARRFSQILLTFWDHRNVKWLNPNSIWLPHCGCDVGIFLGDRTWRITTKMIETRGRDCPDIWRSHRGWSCDCFCQDYGIFCWKGWEKDMFFRCFLDDCHLQPLQPMFRCILAPAEPPNTEDPETSAAPWDCDSVTSNAGP